MTFQALSSVVSVEKKVVLCRPRGSKWNTGASVLDNSGILNPKDQQNGQEKWRGDLYELSRVQGVWWKQQVGHSCIDC